MRWRREPRHVLAERAKGTEGCLGYFVTAPHIRRDGTLMMHQQQESATQTRRPLNPTPPGCRARAPAARLAPVAAPRRLDRRRGVARVVLRAAIAQEQATRKHSFRAALSTESSHPRSSRKMGRARGERRAGGQTFSQLPPPRTGRITPPRTLRRREKMLWSWRFSLQVCWRVGTHRTSVVLLLKRLSQRNRQACERACADARGCELVWICAHEVRRVGRPAGRVVDVRVVVRLAQAQPLLDEVLVSTRVRTDTRSWIRTRIRKREDVKQADVRVRCGSARERVSVHECA